ncbi:MAG: hypothetical protein HGA90_05540, partial [Alphaproteobacteria bacterium]|nr:hypothetical protein [Alphaproteobacteria bacterium]
MCEPHGCGPAAYRTGLEKQQRPECRHGARQFDLGSGGVLIPLVDDAAAAQAAVAACRYAPEGRRGVAPRRAANYNRDTATYLAEANSLLI